MPYKDIEKNREAWRRWKKRNYEKHKKNQAIQKQAVYANPVPQICIIKDCLTLGERHHPKYEEPKKIIWLCKKHHELIHHVKVCSICGKKHRARGYCNSHWKLWRKGKL